MAASWARPPGEGARKQPPPHWVEAAFCQWACCLAQAGTLLARRAPEGDVAEQVTGRRPVEAVVRVVVTMPETVRLVRAAVCHLVRASPWGCRRGDASWTAPGDCTGRKPALPSCPATTTARPAWPRP